MASNRIVYAFALLMALAFVYIYDVNITYTALYVVLALPFVSLAAALYANRALQVYEKLQSDLIIKGERTIYRLSFKNESFLPIFGICDLCLIGFGDAEITKQSFILPGKSVRKVDNDIIGEYRGVYKIGTDKIALYDCLGLFKFKHKIERTLSVTVYPRTVKLRTLKLSAFETETDMRRRFAGEDYSSVADLRKYNPSDGMKRIHWKASAKKNDLIAKNYQSISKEIAILLFDNTKTVKGEDRKILENEDKMVEAYVSVLSLCMKLNHPVKLCYFKDDAANEHQIKRNIEPNNFAELFFKAAMVDFLTPKKSFTNSVDDYINDAAGAEFANIIVFSQQLNTELCNKLLAFSLYGHHVVYINFSGYNENNVVVEETEKYELIKKLTENNVTFYELTEWTEISDVL